VSKRRDSNPSPQSRGLGESLYAKRSNDNRMLSITAENGVEIQYRLAPVSDCQKKFKKVKNGLKTCHFSSAPRGCIVLPCFSFESVNIRPLQRKIKFRNFLRQMDFWGQYVGPPSKCSRKNVSRRRDSNPSPQSRGLGEGLYAQAFKR